jgi:hypothetical protein
MLTTFTGVALVVAVSAGTPLRATTMQPPGLKIVVVSGEDAVNIIQQKTAVAPVVEVRDRNDLPVAGVTVTFTIGGGNTAAFAGGVKTITLTTNAAGRAAASGLTPLSNGTVQVNVSAAFQGQTATATITQTNFATAAQAAQGGNAGAQGAAQAGGFPLKTVIFLGAAGAGSYVAYDMYQKYGPSSGSNCTGTMGGPGSTAQIPASGGTFAVTVDESCPYRVTTNVPWISFSVSSTQVFQGALSFTYTAAANAGPARSGMINFELADGTGGMGFGVNQAAGSLNTFRGTVSSVAAGAYIGDRLCGRTLFLSGVTAALTRVDAVISQAEVTVVETQTPAPGCPTSTTPSSQRTYVLESGSVTGQTIVMRLASTSDAALRTLSFSGTLSPDNRTITGSLTWLGNGGASTAVTSPITFSVAPD